MATTTKTTATKPAAKKALAPKALAPKAKAPAAKAPATPTEDDKAATDTTTDEVPALSRATREGEAECPACDQTLPVTKFPTYNAGDRTYERDLKECRSCRDERRAAERAAKRNAEAKA